MSDRVKPPSAREWKAVCSAAALDYKFEGLCANDSWNLQHWGITQARGFEIRRVVERMHGGDWKTLGYRQALKEFES